MKARWMKRIKRIAVFILTAALLTNAVDYSQLLVKAETIEDSSESGSDEGGGSEAPSADNGSGDEAPSADNGSGDEGPSADNGGGDGGAPADNGSGDEETPADSGSGDEAPSADGGSGDEGAPTDGGSGDEAPSADSGNGEEGGADAGSGSEAPAGDSGSGNEGGASAGSGGEAPAGDSGSGNEGGAGAGSGSEAPAGDSGSGNEGGADAGSGSEAPSADSGSGEEGGAGAGSGSETPSANGGTGSADGSAESGSTLTGSRKPAATANKGLNAAAGIMSVSALPSGDEDASGGIAPAAVSPVIVKVTVKYGEEAVTGATVSFENSDQSSEIAFTDNGDGTYTSGSEISEDGTISISKDRYNEENIEFIFADYDETNGLTAELTKKEWKYLLTINGDGAGTVKAGDSSVTGDFTADAEQITVTVVPDGESYISSVMLGDEEKVSSPTEEELSVTMNGGDALAVTFAKKPSVEVTAKGEGGVYRTDDADREDNLAGQTIYYMPGSAPELVVKAAENWYIDSVCVIKNDSVDEEEKISSPTDGEFPVTMSEGENLKVTFAKKPSAEITVKGSGSVYKTNDTEQDNLASQTIYYMPDSAPELAVQAAENWYIDSVNVNGSDVGDFAGKIESSYDGVQLGNDLTNTVAAAFLEKWMADELKGALESANSVLQSAAYNTEVTLNAPENDKQGYTYVWTVEAGAPAGVEITENVLKIPRNAAGKSFQISAEATLTRGDATESVGPLYFEITPQKIAAAEGSDYSFTKVGDWITAITLSQDANGNNFSNYALTGTDLSLNGVISGAAIELGEIEVTDGKLVLSGVENSEDYSSDNGENETVLSNLRIDTKAPTDPEITYELETSDGSKETAGFDGDNLCKTNRKAILTVTAADGGSGLAGAVLTYTDGNGQEQRLTADFDTDNKAVFTLGDGEYGFTKLTVTDNAENSAESDLDKRFSVDTTLPKMPAAAEESDSWRTGASLSYSLSCGSQDTEKFVICRDDGSLDWGAVESAVTAGTVPDGAEVLDAANASASWKFQVPQGEILDQAYQIKALDGHGNFSQEALSYTVKIDNQEPEISGIGFEKEDEQNPFGWTDQLAFQQINASVAVSVTGISDGSGSGVARVCLVSAEDGSETEVPLTYDASSGEAGLEITAEGTYVFKELRVYDSLGNCLKRVLDVSFRLDTTAPAAPVIAVSQKDAESGAWIMGTDCAYSITSGSDAADAYCFEIYEADTDAEQEPILVTPEDISGDSAAVIWNLPLGKEEVHKRTYKIRARDCADAANTANTNYSDFVEFTVQIDNKMPVIEEAGFAYTDQEGVSQKVAADVATDGAVQLSIGALKDGENPPEDQAGLESVTVSYEVETRRADAGTKTTEVSRETREETLSVAADGSVNWEFDSEAGSYYRYSNLVVTAKDKLGNTRLFEELKGYAVEIDRRGPVIRTVDWNAASADETYWFRGEKSAHRFVVTAEDDTELAAVTITAVDDRGQETDSYTRKVSGKSATVNFGAWVYDRNASQAFPDKKETYTIKVTDRFGNVTNAGETEDFSEDPAPREVRIDRTLPVIAGAEENEAQVRYRFSNVKAENAEVADGALTQEEHLVNGLLVSREDVIVTVSAFDPKMDADGETVDGTASGIVKAELLVETEGKAPEAILFDRTAPNLESSHDYVFELAGVQGQETVFVLKALRLTDLAGNVKEYTYEDGEEAEGKLGALTVVVDHRMPEAAFVIDAYRYHNSSDALTGWYSAADKTPIKLTANAADAYGVYAIDWYRTTFEKGVDVVGMAVQKNAPSGAEDAAAFADTLNLTQEQDQLYAVKVTDWAGNEKVFCSNSVSADGSRIRIDNTAPQDYALIHWEGDYGSSFNDVEQEYEAAQEGFVYNQNRVTLSVLVRDELADGLLDGAKNGKVSSDIERVEVTINHENSSETMTKVNDRTVALAEVQGETYLEFRFENIELTADAETEVEKYIESIVIYDNAGNKTPAEGRLFKDDIKYILDSKAPRLTVDYHEGSYVESALFPDTYFYDGDPSVNAVIEERYFYSEDVKTNLHEPEAEGTLNQSEWSAGGIEHNSVFSAPSDGRYRFSLEYTDRSGNQMVGDQVSGGRYVSKYVVMDTTVPEIEITYEYNGHDVTDEIYDGNFFAGTVTATVRIREMNFDPDMVEIEATGRDSQSNSGIGISWDGSWTQESAEVNVNTVTFDQQGTYEFTCTCRDIVGHEAQKPAQSHFVVDTTKPEVEITYDLNDPMNEKYYQAVRTATVRVTDRSFDPEQTEFLIETSGPNPVIGEWVHRGGGGCENQPTYHVDGCIYEATVVFAEDGDYSLGFSCVDKAGNESEVVLTDPFTVDQTAPELSVTYDNNDARNDYYYNAQRTGTIRIVEHNFEPADVQIVTTAQRTEAGAPGISGWRSEGDVHTTTISYDADADYTFDISYADLAGNESESYAGDRFVVDTTVPVLAITDIEDRSANNGTVAPGIEWSDINLDADGVFMSLTGANNGEVTVATAETVIEGGRKIQYQDFPHEKEMDDLYTFQATVTDLAGNVSEQTVLFSVNRFGSVYVFDTATQEIVDRYYINRPAHLNVTEINVDTLEFKEITYSKDGDIVTMKAGEDYEVTQSGTEATWKSYNYDIFDHSFTEEGTYAVTIYSEDRATNRSNNIVKEKVIGFCMDVTSPTVVVTGVENDAQYNENSRTVTIDAKDNIYLAGVTAYLDGQPVVTFDEETLLQNGGVVTMEIGSSNEWQRLTVKAVDAAGNEGVSDEKVFLITRNILVQWYRNTVLFWGSIGCLAVLAAGFIFFLFYKKKKKEQEEA